MENRYKEKEGRTRDFLLLDLWRKKGTFWQQGEGEFGISLTTSHSAPIYSRYGQISYARIPNSAPPLLHSSSPNFSP